MPELADQPDVPLTAYDSATELFLHHPVPMWVYERETLRFLAVNEAAVAQYGYTRDEFLDATIMLIQPDLPAHVQTMLRHNPGRRRRWRPVGVAHHQRRDGTTVDAEVSAHDLLFSGRPSVVVAAYDVTERLMAEAATREKDQALIDAHERLQESETRYRDLVENLDDVVFVVDAAGLVQYTSQAVQHFGYGPHELVGRPFISVVHPDDRGASLAGFADTLNGSRQKREFRVLDKDGHVRYVRSSNRVTYRNGIPVSVTGVLSDITEQVRTQEQLQSAGRIEAVGRLAGGIAHDFNNLLVAITGFAELSLSSLPEDDPLHGDISEILRAGQRAAALTGQLLAFSRRQVLRPDSVQLCEVVTAMEPMLRRLIGEDIELSIGCDEQLGAVHIDPGHLEQVVMNLVVNARDAMPEGGRLRIETSAAGFPTGRLPSALRNAPLAVLSVSDTGIGMDDATQARMFEPFFTTKPMGQGTGLGLAMVFGFVQQSGGAVAVESAPGKGTTFRIALPLEPAHDTQVVTTATTTVQRGTGTVLLAEDEDTVRVLTTRLLEAAGYRVLPAATGQAALQLCRTHPGSIDLLLTDVVMPAMNGTTLAERVNELRPGIHTLFMSGYSGPDVLSRGLDDLSAALLQKPFTAAELSTAVQQAIGVH